MPNFCDKPCRSTQNFSMSRLLFIDGVHPIVVRWESKIVSVLLSAPQSYSNYSNLPHLRRFERVFFWYLNIHIKDWACDVRDNQIRVSEGSKMMYKRGHRIDRSILRTNSPPPSYAVPSGPVIVPIKCRHPGFCWSSGAICAMTPDESGLHIVAISLLILPAEAMVLSTYSCEMVR